MIPLRRLSLVAAAVALSQPLVCLAAKPLPVLVLVGTVDTERSQGRLLTMIYAEALRRIGYRLEYRAYPAKRAMIMSEQGEVDGEIHRVASYGLTHPNMMRVEPAHFNITFSAYADRKRPLGDGWQALHNTAYRVEYRAGVFICEERLPEVVAPDHLSSVNNTVLGLRKLALGRTDIYIDVETVTNAALALPEMRNSTIRKVAQMEEIGAHAYLHKKNAALLPRLSAALAEIKREGLIERYRLLADRVPPAAPN